MNVLRVTARDQANAPVTSDDGRGVDLVLDEVVGSPEQLGGQEDDRRRSVSNLLVLLLSKRDEDSTLAKPRTRVKVVSTL